MLSSPYKRMIKYGFYKPEYSKLYSNKTPAQIENSLVSLSEKDAEKHSDVEYAEEFLYNIMPTDYPRPVKRYWLTLEAAGQSIEEFYYWFYHQVTVEHSLKVQKIIDTYAASEASSFFGMMQQRLSIQQGNVSNFLKGISDMLKGLFQIVREIRILNDRLQYYVDTYEQNENALSSEIVLKGLWVDQVEGGAKNPASVYGLASQVGFTILPDLFFRIKLKGPKEVDRHVDKLQFNEKVKEILKRKLRQYYEWKVRTFSELETRKKFELKYLRQHYETIKLYISWIKPYLRYINRMQQSEKNEMSPELIKSFEGAFVEIEIVGKKKGSGRYNQVLVLNFQHRTRPETVIHQPQEYSQRGPLHIGRSHVKIRAYVWTDEQIENYIKYRQEEDIALLSAIDDSVKEAIDALGDELKSYLGMEGERFGEEKRISEIAKSLMDNGAARDMDGALKKAKDLVSASKERAKPPGAIDPFMSVFKGFGEMLGISGISMPKKKAPKPDSYLESRAADETKTKLLKIAYLTFKNYKKSHKMLTW